MSFQDQAFNDGFLEVLQKFAFCAGFLEASSELGDPELLVKTAYELAHSRVSIEPLKATTSPVQEPQPVHPEQSWIQISSDLSPPGARRYAA